MERISGSIKRIRRKLRDSGFAKKFVTALVVVSTTLNPLSPVFATAAQAAETPETATVTLMETDHGTLSFDGTDDRAITVDVGSEVTVNATPDDGYFADTLAVFTSETEATSVDVTDGKATFTVNGDVSVTCAFNENGTAGSSALKPVTVDEQSTNTSIEQYIRDHADAQYVGEGDDLTREDVLTVTTTVVDGSKLPDATLESLWETDEDGDGMSDNWDAMISNAVSHAVLFEVDPDADYYVGWAGADIEGAKLTDWAAVENNADAVVRDGFIVDEATGLVYVPKSYTELNDEGEPMVESSRIQLVYTVENAAAEATFDFTTNMTDVSGNVPSEGKVSVPVITTNTRVTIAPDDETREDVRTQTVDSVTVNGIEYTPDMDMWTYDSDTGVLTFNMAPTGIHAMTVNMSNNVGKDIVALFGLTAQQQAVARSASVNNIGTWQFESTPVSGLNYNVAAHNTYSGTDLAGYAYPAVENPRGGGYERKTVQQALGWQGVDLSALQAGRYAIKRTSSIQPQTVDAIMVDGVAVTIPSVANLNLTCCHAEIGPDFTYQPGYNEPAAMEDDLGARVRIAAVNGNTAIIGVTVPTSHTQAGAGFFEINWDVAEGGIGVVKSSASPSITDGNSLYALSNAQYGVYSDPGCTQLVATLSTDAEGRSDYWGVKPGTYYLKEIAAPEGYFVDDTVYPATVNGGNWTRVEVADIPASDPAMLLVGKYDGEKTYTSNGNLPQGSASLAGAEFTVEYYDTLDYDSYDALKEAGVEPTRSWVVKTDADGYADLSPDYLVSGDALYYVDQTPTLPRGTIVSYESKAPEGYNLNTDDVSFQKIQEDVTAVGTVTYNTPQVPESVKRGGVSVKKLDSQTGSTPQGDGNFKGITFSVINNNDHSVIVNGNEYAPGKVVTTITTDENGNAATADDALPYGKYIIRETATNDYYLNTADDIYATVSENGTVYSFTASDDIARGGVSVKKLDSQTGSTPQGDGNFKGITFSVINNNDHSVIVNGNEYAPGKVVTTITTDENGNAATADDALPYGKYIIRETATNDYYLNTADDIYATVSENGTVYSFTASDDIARGGVEVYKRDIESDLSTPLGSASLDGTQFEVTTLNDNPVIVDGVTYSKGQVVKTLTIKDGYAATSADCLPVGDYSLQEVKAGDGYLLTDGTAYEFTVSKNGEIVNPVTGDGHVHNQVKRGDLELNKRADDDGDRLAGVAFKVTSQTTGESHVIVTDENGYFSSASSWNAHTQNTNGNDWAIDADGTIDSSKLDTTAGVWFGLTTEGTTVDADDALGALPYDTYTIEELPCTANEHYQLINTTVTITRDGVTVDLGTLDDQPQGTVVISTRAYDPTDNDSYLDVGDVTLADKVSYSGLTVGKEYKLVTTIVDASTGEPIVIDDSAVTGSTTFTAQATSGYEVVQLNVPTFGLGGKTITVYEELYLVSGGSETLVAEHEDKGDVDQQLKVVAPEIGTTATDGVDGDKNVVPDDVATVNDTVAYKNLIPGKEYTVTGKLMVKGTDEDGNATEEALLDADGNPVTASTTFTPDTADGSVTVTFTFDSAAIPDGTQLVAFESLSLSGIEVAAHADINDYGQTVTVDYPEIGTTATDGFDGDKNVVADGNSTVVDTVSYTGLVPGREYTVTGKLMVKGTDEDGNATEEALLDADGNPVTASTTFTPDTADGSVTVTFTFDSAAIPDGTQLVAFESLDRVGVELAVHADINDEAQTVTVHETNIGTIASDGLDGDKSVIADSEATITDDVAYNNTLVGNGYTMAGILMDKTTGLPILTGDGSEKYSEDDVKDFMDELFGVLGVDAEGDMTVDIDALDKLLSDNADLVDYMVFASAEFAPETSSGSVSMDFNFDANDIIDRLNGETKDVVVYEMMFKGSFDDENGNAPVIVATELDLDNGDQTVTVIPSVIGTTATDSSDGDHELMAGQDATIVDTVTYEGLIPGKEYTLKATLYDKATGQPLSVGDKHVTAELKFTPNSQSGSVDIELGPFDASELDGHTLVVFEELYKQSLVDGETTDILVAEHKDINDEDQSVNVTSAPVGSTIDKTTPGSTYGKTGGSNANLVAAMVLLLASALGFTVYGLRKRHVASSEGDMEDTLTKPTDGSDD